MAINWTCPYCQTKTTLNNDTYTTTDSGMHLENPEGPYVLRSEWTVCPNEECQKISLDVILYKRVWTGKWQYGEEIKHWPLLPGSFAKAFPEYIPLALRQDYEEASAILHLSPKASATLSRRCIQGIIRDFWNVKKGRLIDEINAIKELVDPLTWKSIDAIRKVGNIGAHMEKDINLIIDVESKEAYLLIQMIELLFEEWYIHRHERELKLKSIVDVADKKQEQKKKKEE